MLEENKIENRTAVIKTVNHYDAGRINGSLLIEKDYPSGGKSRSSMGFRVRGGALLYAQNLIPGDRITIHEGEIEEVPDHRLGKTWSCLWVDSFDYKRKIDDV
jgi:hypothetical protein